MDDTFGKSIKVKDFFPDVGKCIKSVTSLQKVVGLDILDGKKCYHLRKHVTGLRKVLKVEGGKKNET